MPRIASNRGKNAQDAEKVLQSPGRLSLASLVPWIREQVHGLLSESMDLSL